MFSRKIVPAALAAAGLTMTLAATPLYGQAGGDGGPPRIVWAAQAEPETAWTAPNRPVTHLADILKAHKGQQSWEHKVLLTRDYDGRYNSLAPGETTKAQFYADDRCFMWVYSGQMKVTIDGQQPFTATKGFLIDVAPRLSYKLENTGSEPVVFWRVTPAGQLPSYPASETPTPVKGFKYVQSKITETGGYEGVNQPYLDFNAYAAGGGKSRDFAYDGHTSAHIIRAGAIKELPPADRWGHFHENMVEAWVVIEGQLDVLVSGKGIVSGQFGDVIMVPTGRWHRATSHPNSGPSTRLAMTPRLKEGQVHYMQVDGPPGN